MNLLVNDYFSPLSHTLSRCQVDIREFSVIVLKADLCCLPQFHRFPCTGMSFIFFYFFPKICSALAYSIKWLMCPGTELVHICMQPVFKLNNADKPVVILLYKFAVIKCCHSAKQNVSISADWSCCIHTANKHWPQPALTAHLSDPARWPNTASQCWNWLKRTGGGGQQPKCLKFCSGIEI